MSTLITKDQKEIAFRADKQLRGDIVVSLQQPSPLAHILQLSGNHREEDYKAYAEAVWQISAVQIVLDERGMDVNDMELIAWGLVLPVLPSPTILDHNGSSILIPTLFILEPERLHALACDLERIPDRESKMAFLSNGAQAIHTLHQKARGAGSLSAPKGTPGGCFGLVLALSLVFALLPLFGVIIFSLF